MSNPESSNTPKTLLQADKAIADLHRAVAGVDRFNPGYFRALGSIILMLSGIALGLALEILPSATGSQLVYLAVAFLGITASLLTLLEARKYARRWQRALTHLTKVLQDAEGLAGFAFVTIDKARDGGGDREEIKSKYLELTYAIRDARERLGLKD